MSKVIFSAAFNNNQGINLYNYSGSIEIWALFFKGEGDDISYQKFLGNAVLESDGEVSFEFDASEVAGIEGGNQLFLRINYFDGEKRVPYISEDGNYDTELNAFEYEINPEDDNYLVSQYILIDVYNYVYNPEITSITLLLQKNLEGDEKEALVNLRFIAKIRNFADTTTLLDLGENFTNSEGYCLLVYEKVPNQYKVLIELPDYGESDVLNIPAEPPLEMEFNFTLPDAPSLINTISIVQLASTLGFGLTGLTSFLAEFSLTTLHDVRKAGNLKAAPSYGGLSTEAKNNLDVILEMSRIELFSYPDNPTDYSYYNFNNMIRYGIGIKSMVDVVALDQETFIKTVKAIPDIPAPSDFKLASIYRLAQTQYTLFSNLLPVARVNQLYMRDKEIPDSMLGENHTAHCGCEECKSSVSPLAYLSSLLDYCKKRLKKSNAAVSITILENALKQPFGQLPTKCDEVKSKICNFRIAVEILYKYLQEQEPPLDPSDCNKRNFYFRKREFLENAYTFLLEKAGTSYQELKNTVNDIEKQKAIAERIGIVFVDGIITNTVFKMYIDIDQYKNEIPYGEDPDPYPYLQYISNLELLLIDVFGLAKDSTGPFATIAESLLLRWQLQYLSDLFIKQDTNADDYLNGILPVIDPDIVNAEDIRYGVQTSSYPVEFKPLDDNLTFEVWQQRKDWGNKFKAEIDTNFYSSGGLSSGINAFELDLDNNSNFSFVEKSYLSLVNAGEANGNYKIAEIAPGSIRYYTVLVDPIKATILPDFSEAIFPVFSEIDSYGTYSNPNLDINLPSDEAMYFYGNSATFYNSVSEVSRIYPAKKISNSLIRLTLTPSEHVEFTSLFNLSQTKILINLKTPVKHTTLSREEATIYAFGELNSSSDLGTAGKEIRILGTDLNDGKYKTVSSGVVISNYEYDDFLPVLSNVKISAIKIDMDLDETGFKNYLFNEEGKGEISYLKTGITINSVDTVNNKITLASPFYLDKELFPGDEFIATYGSEVKKYTVQEIIGLDVYLKENVLADLDDYTGSFVKTVKIVQKFPLFDFNITGNYTIFHYLMEKLNLSTNPFEYVSIFGTFSWPCEPKPWIVPSPSAVNLINFFKTEANKIKQGIDSNEYKKLHFTKESFVRFAFLYENYINFLSDTLHVDSPSAADYEEMITILLDCAKRALIRDEETGHSVWIAEEVKLKDDFNTSGFEIHSLLDARIFQISDYEETKRNFGTQNPDLFLRGNLPGLASPPESPVGIEAKDVLNKRISSYEQMSSYYKNILITSGCDALLREVYGLFLPNSITSYFDTISQNLNSINPEVSESAEILLKTQLFLSVDSFNTLKDLRSKLLSAASNANTVDIKNQFLQIILNVLTVKVLDPLWAEVESEIIEVSGQIFTRPWLLQRQGYSSWLYSTQQRNNWKNALNKRLELVAVDPDIVKIEEIKAITTSPAFTIYKDRKDILITWNSTTILGTPAIDKFNYIVTYFLEISNALWLQLIEKDDLGININGILRQLNLDRSAFYRLKLIQRSIIESGNYTDAYKEEFLNILVQVRKVRNYGLWRDQELAETSLPIAITPYYFELQEENYQPYALDEAYYVKWRSDLKRRKKWEQLLEARTDRENNCRSAEKTNINDCESRYLNLLRDAYLYLLEEEVKTAEELEWEELHDEVITLTLQEIAQRFSDRLYYDFKENCCQDTTRVSTAIQTLQTLLWAENTGLIENNGQNFKLVAPYFYQEWTWIGNYGSFRSAVFVFLYPENLLHPQLRKDFSPGFANISNLVNNGGRFTPETACELADIYEEYLKDISSLEVEATCTANITSFVGDGCTDQEQSGLRRVFFSFAQARNSKKCYFSVSENDLGQASKQGYWEEMVGFGKDVVRILGCATYKIKTGARYLFVFAEVNDKGDHKIAQVKLDMDKLFWDEEYETLDFPKEMVISQFVVVQRHNETNPPVFLFKTRYDEFRYPIYMHTMNDKGDGFQKDDAQLLSSGITGYRMVLKAGIEVGDFNNSNYLLSFVLICKYEWAENLWFMHYNEGRPEPFLGLLKYPSPSGSFNNLPVDNYLNPQTNDSSFANLRFKGCYSKPNSNKRFALIAEEVNGGVVKQFDITLEDNTASFPLNIHLDFLEVFIAQYGGISLKKEGLEYYELINFNFYSIGIGSFGKNAYEVLKWLLDFKVNRYIHLYDSNNNLVNEYLQMNHSSFPLRYIKIANAILDKIFFLTKRMADEGHPDWLFLRNYVNDFSSYTDNNFSAERPTLDYAFVSLIFSQVERKIVRPGYSAFTLNGVKTLTNASKLVFNHQYTFNYNGPLARTYAVVQLNNRYYRHLINADDLSKIISYNNVPVSPNISSAFGIILNNKSDLFQARRNQIIDNYNNNSSNSHLNTYVWEAYYFVPMLFAIKLQENGYYDKSLEWYRSVFDYSRKLVPQRKIFYGLVKEESNQNNYNFSQDWFLDPLDPHKIAQTRCEAYTAFTVSSIVKCFLAYADEEFTKDTVETINKAKELYNEALSLLDLGVMKEDASNCTCSDMRLNIIEKFRCFNYPQLVDKYSAKLLNLGSLMNRISTCSTKDTTLNAVYALFSSVDTDLEFVTALGSAEALIITAIGTPSTFNLGTLLDTYDDNIYDYANQVTWVQSYNTMSEKASALAYNNFSQNVSLLTGYDQTALLNTATSLPFFQGDEVSPGVNFIPGNSVFSEFRSKTPFETSSFAEMSRTYEEYPNIAIDNLGPLRVELLPSPLVFEFCVPFNPVYSAYRIKAEVNLFKLRNCMNIAGMKRELEPFAAPTDTTSGLPSIGAGGQLVIPGNLSIKPTQYRYDLIIERAKQLAQQANQFESVYLSTLEKKDAEAYTLMKAKQDMKLSKANVKLSDLRIKVAEGEVELAQLQKDRSLIQSEKLNELISSGLNQYEQAMMEAYNAIKFTSIASAAVQAYLGSASTVLSVSNTVASAAATTDPFMKPAAVAAASAAVSAGVLSVTSGLALMASNIILANQNYKVSTNSIMAGLENRRRDWQFQQVLTQQDIKIGSQQVKIAQDRLRVSGQEKQISELQSQFAEDTLEFLNNKFTNVELYTWMSNVLAGVYASLLQQATATARMAMNQLAFERQQIPPVTISEDYWEAPSQSVSLGGNGPDRRGLTGSARLIQDITRLDEYAFSTDKRKLELSKTFSLVTMAPLEFQQFRESGVITFDTLMDYFDRDFQGHYMRIIRKVNVSVIALIPPTEGIKATLTCAGISQVVVPGDIFQINTIRRDPEMIAFTSPINASGILDLQAQSKFMNPFEGNGVATRWEFSMPRENNLIDFSSIADVLLTIEYTAFNSYDYRQQVLRSLPLEFNGERMISMRQELPDQFYELAHPEELETPFVCKFKTNQYDFPPGLKEHRIKGLKIFIQTKDNISINDNTRQPFMLEVGYVAMNESIGDPQELYEVSFDNRNLASTASGGGGGLTSFLGKSPFGDWTIDMNKLNVDLGGSASNLEKLKEMFTNGEIVDIMLIIDFEAEFLRSQTI